MTILSFTLVFPICYRNRKNFGKKLCSSGQNNFISTDIKYDVQLLHPYIVSISRVISNFIIVIFSIFFVILFFFGNENDFELDIEKFKLPPVEETIDTKKLLLPNICYSSVYNIPLPYYLPFINDAYYFGNFKKKDSNEENNKNSSLVIDEFKNLFFNDSYEIDVFGNLIQEKNTVKMVQYNVRNAKNYITILSIKGTTYNTDIFLDAQLYFSSILLSISSSFSISTEKDSHTFNFIEYGLNIPYRMFFKFLLIDKYMNKLKDAFIKNEYSFYKNVVIVGHSLGGGLAKLFGRFIGKQAISLSGPGINAFHSLWNYKGNSENFGISSIDIVPDKDIVPRVEISGGTIYRILCKSAVLSCHSKELSLCEVLIMCRNPNYENYCKSFAKLNDKTIKDILRSSELNN